ncbi:hypothetical protein ACIO3O_38945 [Streptomyces sp. NPDC087440]|uniref:hypothetical protein n=1 Tax=Streptomyces sp. NPDC087440 TaxID=3365790 RepID=UPI00381F8AF3
MTTISKNEPAQTPPVDKAATDRTLPEELAGTYGYIWADWLYGKKKNAFMVSVYNDCHAIEQCRSPAQKADLLKSLRGKVSGSSEPWVEGIEDFLDFETSYLAQGTAPVEVLADSDEYRALGVLEAAYRHGAFRGLCRTDSGAEWIGLLGEFCAAAVHQGFKWVRTSGGVDEWELPAMSEAWCKGAALWGLVCTHLAVDEAGPHPANDAALERIHDVIAPHHMAGALWTHYRGTHPHQTWSPQVRGRAPGEAAIRTFGDAHKWPAEMIDILVRGADHVNTWVNPPAPASAHMDRTRDLLISDHTPRLKGRVMQMCDELQRAVGDMNETEVAELRWRGAAWMSTLTTNWRGRGSQHDRVIEVSFVGALTGVLRESRPHITAAHADRIFEWCAQRASHLPPEERDPLLKASRSTLEIRGRVPGILKGYGSAGTGHTRWVDGVWELATMAGCLVGSGMEDAVPENARELACRFFNASQGKRRKVGIDVGPDDDSGGCLVCVGDELFRHLVGNRPSTGVLQCSIWGVFHYGNGGLGEVADTSLGTRGT